MQRMPGKVNRSGDDREVESAPVMIACQRTVHKKRLTCKLRTSRTVERIGGRDSDRRVFSWQARNRIPIQVCAGPVVGIVQPS